MRFATPLLVASSFIAAETTVNVQDPVYKCKQYFSNAEVFMPQCVEECVNYGPGGDKDCHIKPDDEHSGALGPGAGYQLIGCVGNGQPVCWVKQDEVTKCRKEVGHPTNPAYQEECKNLCVYYGNRGWGQQ